MKTNAKHTATPWQCGKIFPDTPDYCKGCDCILTSHEGENLCAPCAADAALQEAAQLREMNA